MCIHLHLQHVQMSHWLPQCTWDQAGKSSNVFSLIRMICVPLWCEVLNFRTKPQDISLVVESPVILSHQLMGFHAQLGNELHLQKMCLAPLPTVPFLFNLIYIYMYIYIFFFCDRCVRTLCCNYHDKFYHFCWYFPKTSQVLAFCWPFRLVSWPSSSQTCMSMWCRCRKRYFLKMGQVPVVFVCANLWELVNSLRNEYEGINSEMVWSWWVWWK